MVSSAQSARARMVKTAGGKPVKDQMRTLARRTLEPHELSSKFQGRLSRLFCRCAGFADSGSCAAMAEDGRVLVRKEQSSRNRARVQSLGLLRQVPPLACPYGAVLIGSRR